MSASFITGLDIGTSSIKSVVAENKGGKLFIRGAFLFPSAGLRKGALTELAEASQGVIRAVAEIKKISKAAAKNIYINIGTPQVKVQQSRGIVAVSRADTEIYQDDVDKVVRASQAVNLPPNRTIIHNITREFIVDGVGDISDPLGLSGSRLEVSSFVVDAFSPHVKNIARVVELAGGEVGGLVFSPLVAARPVLSRAQKDLGSVLVDMGAGTTGMAVYEEKKLVGMAKFPVGSSNISNDLAIGLKIPVDAAEKLKLGYGYALSKDVPIRENVELAQIYDGGSGSVSRRYVAEIIEARLAEIFDFVNNELKLLGRHGQLPGGAVFVGGGSKIPGLADLARRELKLSSQIGMVQDGEWEIENESLRENLEDPEFASALGLALWGTDDSGGFGKKDFSGFNIRNAIRYFLP